MEKTATHAPGHGMTFRALLTANPEVSTTTVMVGSSPTIIGHSANEGESGLGGHPEGCEVANSVDAGDAELLSVMNAKIQPSHPLSLANTSDF